MTTKVSYVGLDVHKETIVIAVARQGRSAAEKLGTIPNDWALLRKKLKKIGSSSYSSQWR